MAEEETAGDFTKPAYDARQVYYTKIIIPILERIIFYISLKDFDSWLREDKNLFTHVEGYIDPKQISLISKKINSASLLLFKRAQLIDNKNNMMMIGAIEDAMWDLHRSLITASKHLYLPIKSEEITEWDEAEFLRGSDL